MKRVNILLAALWLFTVPALADNDRISKNLNDLPRQSREFLAEHFAGLPVSHIKIEKNLIGTDSYDVILTDGTKIEFDKSGTWEEVKRPATPVPASVLPAFVQTYVRQHYQGVAIMGIEKDTRKYEVKLQNGIELKFDLQGNLTDID